MDSKNVLLAIICSSIVLIFWAIYFEPTPIPKDIKNKNEINRESSEPSPSLEKSIIKKEISRDDVIKKNKRVKFENLNITGSISLEGALIDDLVFKNYNESLESNKKVVFLNPKNTNNGYYIETGWVPSANDDINLPNTKSLWKIKGNSVLAPNNPVVLEWNNNEGLVFTKKIGLVINHV